MAHELNVAEIIQIGFRMMRKAKLHPHFFMDRSLLKTASYLTFYYLGLPYDYSNREYLNKKITKEQELEIIALFERRILERIPVEYITHESYYCGNKFYVNENVLVPRSLMNTQFEFFLQKIHWENNRVLDLCTGSGCIGITLALLNPKIKVDLSDISTKALEVALINVKNYSLEDRVRCVQSDLFENIQDKYDLIITNPPYVPNNEYQGQPDEVKNEPKIALIAGEDGLDVVKKILVQAKHYLNPNGILIAEVGHSSAKQLKKKYPLIPFQWYKYRNSKKEDPIDLLIRWFGLLDSIFLCERKGLPD